MSRRGFQNTTQVHVVGTADGERFQVGPITVRVLEDGSRTDKRLGAVEITVPPHTDQTPHHLHNTKRLKL